MLLISSPSKRKSNERARRQIIKLRKMGRQKKTASGGGGRKTSARSLAEKEVENGARSERANADDNIEWQIIRMHCFRSVRPNFSIDKTRECTETGAAPHFRVICVRRKMRLRNLYIFGRSGETGATGFGQGSH